jgi:Skp family chaperone for outer membrane proteins
MKKLLIGGAALLASAAALAQVVPATPTPALRAERVETRAEVQAKVAEHFAKLDANHDGSITKVEADTASQAFHAKFTEQAKDRRDDRRDDTFERLDTNRDGAVSRSEWDAGAAQREQRIASRDRNGDGRPDPRGFRHGGMRDMSGFGGRMFEMADANKDGRVTLGEAQAAALQHFDMADANRDGQVTREERRRLHERMRAQHRG